MGRRGLMAALTGGAVLGAVTQWAAWRSDPLPAVVNIMAIVTLLLAGRLLREEMGQRANGRLFELAGVTYAGVGLSVWGTGPFALVGLLSRPVAITATATVMLRYPSERLPSRTARALVVVLFVWLELMYVVVALSPEPARRGYSDTAWWPDPVLSAATGEFLARVGAVGLCVLVVIALVLIRRNLRGTIGLTRSETLPVAVAAAAAAVALGGFRLLSLFVESERAISTLRALQSMAYLVIPLAFAVAVLRRRLVRTAVADVVMGVAGGSSVEEVRYLLRQALRDPDLDVLPTEPGVERSGDRLVVPIRGRDGTPLAAVLADPALRRHSRLVDAAVGAAGLALENARLQEDIRAQLAQVAASRTRIVEAGLAERRRLERDLHDGAQQRLLALTMQLGALRSSAHDDRTRALIDDARADLRTAVGELRDLARGLHPAVLTEAGLCAALESVARRLPVPVCLEVPPRRWSSAAEAAAYFVGCEALTNAAKHARARSARVRVQDMVDRLCIEVVDDGIGGADPRAGSGLVGLCDRVAALGGWLEVDSPPGGGTRIRASIPCA